MGNKFKLGLVLLTVAVMSSCSTKKGFEQTNWLGKNVTIFSEMPENAKVSAERKVNTSLLINSENEFSVKTNRDEQKMVIAFEYLKNEDAAQGGLDYYKEEILFEIPSSSFKKTYTNNELQDVKLLFSKHCYCEGESGYFKVTNGTLKINHTDDKTNVELKFSVPTKSELKEIEFSVE